MPPLPKLRTAGLAELSRQLRFESQVAAHRQLERTEALALEVLADADSKRSYPLEYIVFRITGFRSDSAPATPEPGTSLLGSDVLIADLAAIIELLSIASGLTLTDLGSGPSSIRTDGRTRKGPERATVAAVGDGPWVRIDELAARWRVSTKTIERLRRHGLIARRVRAPDNRRGSPARQRVMLSEVAIRAFVVTERGPRSESQRTKPRPKPRPTDAERVQIFRRAARYHRRFGWSLQRCANRLAARFGRSPQAMARLLLKINTAADRPVFERRLPVSARLRATTARAARVGVKTTFIAGKLDRSRGGVHRFIVSERLALLRSLDLDGPCGPLFDREDAADVLLASRAVCRGLGAAAPATVDETLRLAEAMDAPDAAAETARAVAILYLRFRVRTWLASVRTSSTSAASLHSAETQLLWASRLKAELVRSQLPVAMRTIADRINGRDVRSLPARAMPGLGSSPALLQGAIAGLNEAVDRFDPLRGGGGVGRLAAASTIAVNRAVLMWLRANGMDETGITRVASRAASRSNDAPVADWTRALDPWQKWLEPPEAVYMWIAQGAAIDPRWDSRAELARRVLRTRLGREDGPPKTPTETAREHQSAPARIVTIERTAIARAMKCARTAQGAMNG